MQTWCLAVRSFLSPSCNSRSRSGFTTQKSSPKFGRRCSVPWSLSLVPPREGHGYTCASLAGSVNPCRWMWRKDGVTWPKPWKPIPSRCGQSNSSQVDVRKSRSPKTNDFLVRVTWDLWTHWDVTEIRLSTKNPRQDCACAVCRFAGEVLCSSVAMLTIGWRTARLQVHISTFAGELWPLATVISVCFWLRSPVIEHMDHHWD